MGLKPDFLEALAITVMEHDKLHTTSEDMHLKGQESSFPLCSPRVVCKTGQQADIKVNGLPSREPVFNAYEGSSDLQRPLHVHVNGFGKTQSHSFSSPSFSVPCQATPSPTEVLDGPSGTSLQTVRAIVSPPPVPPPSMENKGPSTIVREPLAAETTSASVISNAASRREVEVTRRKTVVDKIVRGKERNAFKFFVSGFETQTPTQLAVATRRLKALAEEKMPKSMLVRVYGEEDAKGVKKRTIQQQPKRTCRSTPSQECDDSTDLSDVEVKERVDSFVVKWGQFKAAVSSDMEKNAVEIENTSRHVEDLDGFLCEDEQVPSCSFDGLTEQHTCVRIRPIDTKYTQRRRQRFSNDFRTKDSEQKHRAFGTTGSLTLDADLVSCCPLRQIDAFARMISMTPSFSIRSRIDLPTWLNRDGISEERRRCTVVPFDELDDTERPQAASKSKRMRLAERCSVSLTDSSSLEDSDDERKDKSYTLGGYSEKRRHEIRRARNRKKQRRRARRLLGVESNTESDDSLDSYYKVKLEMPKYSDIEVPKWRRLPESELDDLKHHQAPCECCSVERLQTIVARKHLRLAKEERLYFEGKRQEMPRVESDDPSEAEGADLAPLLQCSLTEAERSQYDRHFHYGKESVQKPR